jgi:ATP-dependent exoDNAse (exonuclease V) beta subunit
MLADEFDNLCGADTENPFKKAYKDVCQISAKKDGKGFVSVDFFDRSGYENNMFNKIINILNQLEQNDFPSQEICVLCRTNRQVQDVSAFLESKHEEFPILSAKNYLDVVSNEAFLLSYSSILQTVVAALRVIDTPKNPIPYAELCFLLQKNANQSQKNAFLDISFADVYAFLPIDLRKENLQKLKLLPLYELVTKLLQIFENKLLTKQSAYIFTFLDSVLNYLSDKSSDIGDFVKFWNEELQYRSVSSNISMKGIRIMTIHKAKGLEFGSVILPFCYGEMSESSRGGKKNIVWCEENVAPFDLPIMPIEYNKMMKNSLFVRNFIGETIMLFMDNLNVNYVAFTRAVKNLFICSRKPPRSGEIVRFEKLLQKSLELDNDTLHWQTGEIFVKNFEEKGKHSLNPLKNQGIETQKNSFEPTKDALKKMVFVQSNSSREFLFGENGEKNPYIIEGNVMHRLFSKILTENDIENAVNSLIFDGVIEKSEQIKYINDVKEAIIQSNVIDWFSNKYNFFNEKEILTKTDNYVRIYRPDRVMINKNEVIVADYKFGQEHPNHKKQVLEYMNLLKSIGYKNVSGYLWYVNERKIEKVLD